MTKQIIALYSPCAQSGKSTVADVLVQQGYTRVKFAGILKDMTRTLLRGMGLDDARVEQMVEGDSKESPINLRPGISFTARHLMQTLGAEWGRNLIHRNLWVALTAAKINSIPGNVVVDDMRFPNEFDTILELGGSVIKIVRPGFKATDGHPSEGLLESTAFKWDATICNDSTIHRLRREAGELHNFVQDWL